MNSMKRRAVSWILILAMVFTTLFSNAAMVFADTVPASEPAVAKIGDTGYDNLQEAIDAATGMTGDVTVEIYDKVTLDTSLSGTYDSIKFVGKDTDAEIYLDVQGYITATGKKVAFENLTLSKSAGGFIDNAGFMNVAFGVYDVTEVTYKNCKFANGAYASSGKVAFTGCTFKRSHDKYGLWAYGNVETIVDGCNFDDYRGIKMYAEGKAKTVDLTVKNTNFEAVNDKPAIVLTYGESVELEGNTYSSTGVFELDLDGAPNGTTVTSDVAPTCKNDNGACGVLVDGKIYTTVAQAAEAAKEGSTVTLLHDSTETVEFPEDVTVNTNGYTAENVTVKVSVAQIGDVKYETLQKAFDAAKPGDEVVIKRAGTYSLGTSGKNITITGAVDGVVFDNIGKKNMGYADVTFNNVTFDYYPNVYYTGLQHSGALVYNDCTFEGQVFLYGTSETFNRCTFNQNSPDAYNVWTYSAAKILFNECKFNSAGKSVLIYVEGSTYFNDVAVTDCDFSASQTVDGKAAIEMDSSTSAGINLTIDDKTTAEGFSKNTVSGSDLYNNKNGSEGGNNDIVVEVAGETVLMPTASTLTELNKVLAANQSVKLVDDITYSGIYNDGQHIMVPAGCDVTIDLNGHTIGQTTRQDGGTSAAAIVVRAGAELTVVDSSTAKTGTISACNAAFQLEGKLNLESGNIVIGETHSGADVSAELGFAYGVWMYIRDNATIYPEFNMTGGSISLVTEDAEYDETLMSAVACGGGAGGISSIYNNAVVNIADGVSIEGNIAVAPKTKVTAPAGTDIIRYVEGLEGSGTEEDPYLINCVEELIWFRDKVDEQAQDGSTRFAGKYIKLTADIDLAGINWDPIGSMSGDKGDFKGIFDGGGHTIYNLNVQKDGNGIGLFARTTGNAVIKNLTLHNVTVKSTNNSNYVGGVVGNAFASTKIENVHLTGVIDISGRGYIGGIAGHGYVVMDNVSVVGEGTISSTFWCAGGILGYGGEGTTNIMNANVEGTGNGLTITSAAGGLGAIVGMAEDNNGTQPISGSNLSAANVDIKTYVGAFGTAYANYALGYLYGGNPTSELSGTLSVKDVVVETSTGEVADVQDAVAEVNGKIFFDLASAIAEGGEVKVLRDITLAETITIESEVALDLNGKTVTGADGAIVFNVKANTEIKNGTIKGNKSGTTSGLVDIYADLELNGVTIETSKINALRFKAGDCTATLTECNVTGAFKGYGGSVWDIQSGTYKAASTAINDQLNGDAAVSGGTFYYAIEEIECAPGYTVVDNGDGTYGVEYAPAAFVDDNNNGVLDEGEAVYATLDALFKKHKEGDVYVVLTADIVAKTQVDTDVDAHYYFTTNVEQGVTVDFLFEDDWNYIQKASIGENITLNARYLLGWTDLDIYGTVNTGYAYFFGADVTVHEDGVLNVTTGDKTVQVKDGATLTVKGTVNTGTLNVWVNDAKLVVSGEDAEVNAAWIDIWDGAPTVVVEDGATLDVDAIKASRGGSITVDGATLDAENVQLGHEGSTGEMNVINGGTVTGETKLTTIGDTITGPEGMNVVSTVEGYDVFFEDGIYSLEEHKVARIEDGARFTTLQAAIDAAESGNVIVLLDNIVLTETITVEEDDVITLNLNGKTVSMEDSSGAGCYMIKNYGNLTIVDYSEDESGKLTFNSSTPDNSFGYATSTIGNAGDLTVESGTIENTTVGGASYAIDTIWYTDDVSVTINGGTIEAVKIAVRQVPFSNTANNYLTINGGTITAATGAVQTFNTNSEAMLATVNILGGELNGTYAYYTSYVSAGGSANTVIDITGGTFNGYTFIYNGNTGSSEKQFGSVSISDGTFNDGVYVYTYDANGEEVSIPVISGGTFATAPEKEYIAPGFEIVGEEGAYGVAKDTAVPVVEGVEDGKTYNGKVEFTVSDAHMTVLTVETEDDILFDGGYNDEAVSEEFKYFVPGVYKVTAIDEAGNETIVTFTIEAEHSYDNEVVTAPTCTTAGYTTYTCDCGASYKDDIVEALGHKWDAGKVTTEPTCTKEGVKTFTCQNDATHTRTEAVAKVAHSYKKVVTEPTCQMIGYTTYTCECGDSYIKDLVPAKAHEYKAVVTAPTCEDAGYTTKTCDCGHSYVTAITKALGHKWDAGKVTTEATCTKEGVKTFTCQNDAAHTRTDAIARLPHSHKAVVTAPTCTAEGYTTYTCVCGDTYTGDKVAALGHAVAHTEKTKATTTEDGQIVATCSCGTVISITTIHKVESLKLSIGEATYSGKRVTPSLTIKDSQGNKLKKGTDYTVTIPKYRKNVGKYKYKVTFKGNYSGTEFCYLTINPKAPTIKAPKAAKKAVTVKWNKVSKQVTGYQVMVATDKKFSKNKKSVSVKGYKVVSKKISNLKANKTYFVKVRTYKTVKGVKFYSNWSKVRKVKTK